MAKGKKRSKGEEMMGTAEIAIIVLGVIIISVIISFSVVITKIFNITANLQEHIYKLLDAKKLNSLFIKVPGGF